MAKYEVTVFNQEVREKVEAGERHRQFKDDWADFHYIEITALSEQEAREKAKSRYPSDQGFVIDNIQQSDQGFE
ncbi:MAG: hypothetical protein HQ512_12610 [Rhodospirillales bacterium]|nr:hypothetical protein [Rhodospirillales bacterium]